MNKKQATFSEKWPNNCFVLLQPLDKKVLDQYVKKKEINSKTSTYRKSTADHHKKRAGHRTSLFESYSKNHRSNEEVRQLSKWNLKKSALKDVCVRRKRKIRAKPLYYTNVEEQFSCVNPKENISDKTEALTTNDKLSPTLKPNNAASDEFVSLQILQNNLTSNVKLNETESNKIPKQNSISNETQSVGELKELKSEIILRNILEDSFHIKTNNNKNFKPELQQPEEFSPKNKKNHSDKKEYMENNKNNNEIFRDAVESEVEIIEEYTKSNNFQKKSLGPSNMHLIKPEEKSSPVIKQKLEDEEYDSRDEGEDDTATVIFEKNFEGISEKNAVDAKKKLKVMNRKKETLVKFKRKRSIVGKFFAEVNKPEKKLSETSGPAQLPTENSADTVNKGCITKVCCSIRRLHDLYSIISQLQKDLPKNTEQADHYIKRINIQRENFMEEIKKSQKTIIQGFGKMLDTYGNANKVYWEIGKVTSLSREEISNVISQCTLVKGISEEEKVEEKESNSLLQEVFPGRLGMENYSKKLKKLIYDKIEAVLSAETIEESNEALLEKAIKDSSTNTLEHRPNCISVSVSGPFPLSLHSSGRRKTLLPTPAFPPQIARDIPLRENNLMTHLPSGQCSSVNSNLPGNYQGQWVDHSQCRPCFWPQKNYIQKTRSVVRDPKMKQLPSQNFTRANTHDRHINHINLPSSRPIQRQLLNMGAQYRGNGFTFHSARPRFATSYYSSVNGYFQNPGTSGRNIRFPIPALMDLNLYPVIYHNGRIPVNQCHEILNPSPSDSTAFRPLVQSFAKPGFNNMSIHNSKSSKSSNFPARASNNLRNLFAFSSSQRFECTASSAPKQDNCSVKSNLKNLNRCPQPNSDALNYLAQSHADNGTLINPKDVNANTNNLTQNPTNEPDAKKSESCDLDPTVAQKLTMKNCRLQAGPTLEPKTTNLKLQDTESKIWHQPLTEEILLKNEIGSENFNRTDSNSRVYVCAENYCTNLGVRICKDCSSIIYCSETCQLKHWTQKHKTECHQLKELRG